MADQPSPAEPVDPNAFLAERERMANGVWAFTTYAVAGIVLLLVGMAVFLL
jgi:hypothetical protein